MADATKISLRKTSKETNNFRNFPGADAQRNHEIDMIKQGMRNELFSEQIQDVQSISHNYDEGLLQAWMADRARPDWQPDQLIP